MSDNKVVAITWLDSHHSAGWQVDFKKNEDLVIKSVGFIHHEDSASITITTSRSGNGNVLSPLTIPKCCIVESSSLYNQKDIILKHTKKKWKRVKK